MNPSKMVDTDIRSVEIKPCNKACQWVLRKLKSNW